MNCRRQLCASGSLFLGANPNFSRTYSARVLHARSGEPRCTNSIVGSAATGSSYDNTFASKAFARGAMCCSCASRSPQGHLHPYERSVSHPYLINQQECQKRMRGKFVLCRRAGQPTKPGQGLHSKFERRRGALHQAKWCGVKLCERLTSKQLTLQILRVHSPR